MDLTDEQWAIIKSLIPEPPKRADGKGRPWRDSRDFLNGILWILRTGAPWYDMPKDRYPRHFKHAIEGFSNGFIKGYLKISFRHLLQIYVIEEG
jgi:transposase